MKWRRSIRAFQPTSGMRPRLVSKRLMNASYRDWRLRESKEESRDSNRSERKGNAEELKGRDLGRKKRRETRRESCSMRKRKNKEKHKRLNKMLTKFMSNKETKHLFSRRRETQKLSTMNRRADISRGIRRRSNRYGNPRRKTLKKVRFNNKKRPLKNTLLINKPKRKK